MKRKFLTSSFLVFLTGCGSITVPATGVSSDGLSFVGTTTASMSGGTFSVASANGVTCSGTYNPFDTSKRFKAPFTCTDGRTGVINVVRNNDGLGGKGDATFSDGATGYFEFGKKK